MIEEELYDRKRSFRLDDQKETCYSRDAITGIMRQKGGYCSGLKITAKRFNDLKIGDEMYGSDNRKLIVYKVTDIREDVLRVNNNDRWDSGVVGEYPVLVITYKNSNNRTNSFWLFKEETSSKWDGLLPGSNSLRWHKRNSQHMLYPNTAELAAPKKIFASKEALLGYLDTLREDRMYDVRKAQEELNIKLNYANEYLPLMRELGYEGDEEK